MVYHNSQNHISGLDSGKEVKAAADLNLPTSLWEELTRLFKWIFIEVLQQAPMSLLQEKAARTQAEPGPKVRSLQNARTDLSVT